MSHRKNVNQHARATHTKLTHCLHTQLSDIADRLRNLFRQIVPTTLNIINNGLSIFRSPQRVVYCVAWQRRHCNEAKLAFCSWALLKSQKSILNFENNRWRCNFYITKWNCYMEWMMFRITALHMWTNFELEAAHTHKYICIRKSSIFILSHYQKSANWRIFRMSTVGGYDGWKGEIIEIVQRIYRV